MKRRILSVLCAAAMVLSVAACGSGTGASSAASSSLGSKAESAAANTTASGTGVSSAQTGSRQENAYAPYEEAVTFTKCRVKPAYDQGFKNGDDINNNPYTRYTKERLNVVSELAWEADQNAYDQKLSLAIASGDIPDMLLVNRKIFKQLCENGLIQEMGSSYDNYISDFLKGQYDTYGTKIFDECTVDGKLMGIPGTQIYGQNFGVVWVRTDYLKKVNMEMPKTMDELWAVAKAFVDKDVSGTGKTVGITLSDKVYDKGWTGHGANIAFFTDGALPGWWTTGEDGKAMYGSTMTEMKTTLERFAKMYAEGTLDKEFAVRKTEDRNAMVASGQMGIYFGNWWPEGSMGDCVFNNKEADWQAVVLQGANGEVGVPEDDPVNNIMVVRKDYENPEALVKTLNVFYDALRGNGDGKAVYDDVTKNNSGLDWGTGSIGLQIDSYDAIELLTNDLKQALDKDDKTAMVVQSQSMNFDIIKKERANPKAEAGNYNTTMARTIGSEAIIKDYIKVKSTPFFGQTETMTSKWANLEKLEKEMMVQIIMGEKPIEYFDDFVKQWNALGGQQITDEVNAEIAK